MWQWLCTSQLFAGIATSSRTPYPSYLLFKLFKLQVSFNFSTSCTSTTCFWFVLVSGHPLACGYAGYLLIHPYVTRVNAVTSSSLICHLAGAFLLVDVPFG